METATDDRECVFCYGDIDVRASHCRHCGRAQPVEPSGPGRPWGLWLSIAGLLPAVLVGVVGVVDLYGLLSAIPGSSGGDPFTFARDLPPPRTILRHSLLYVLLIICSGLWLWFFAKMLRNWRKSRDTPSPKSV